MNAEVFVDTNIFPFAISDQAEEQAKAGRARELSLTQSCGWSVQVAGEFFVTATSSKRSFRLSPNQASEYVKTWLNFPTASLRPSTVFRALEIQQRFQVNYWDAAIVAVAPELGCYTTY